MKCFVFVLTILWVTSVLSMASDTSGGSFRLEKRVEDLKAWPDLSPSDRRLLNILETVRVQRCRECLSKCAKRVPVSHPYESPSMKT